MLMLKPSELLRHNHVRQRSMRTTALVSVYMIGAYILNPPSNPYFMLEAASHGRTAHRDW